MSNELGTLIASHTHADGYGIRIGKFDNGEYVVQYVSPHPVYKGKTLVTPLHSQAMHKSEAAARKRANIAWLDQRADARGEKPVPTGRWR